MYQITRVQARAAARSALRKRWKRALASVAATAMIAASLIAGGAAPAMAGTADSSQASARFLSGTLITSDGLLDALAALAGVTAVNAGSPTADTQTDSLHLAAALGVLQVNLPGGVSLPLSQFLKLGAVNQYAQASDNGLSRAGSGAVSDSASLTSAGPKGSRQMRTLI